MNIKNCDLGGEKGGRFIQPCILLSLKEESLHGYALLEKIMAFGFSQEPIDISVIYRHLKKLEENKLISFEWDTTSGGPAKKVYSITETGEQNLRSQHTFWLHRKKRIEAFLEKYNQLLGEI